MASRFSLLLLPLLSLLSLSADARPGVHFHPCNTLIISTFSFSLQNPNPNANPKLPRPEVLALFTDFRPVLRRQHHRFFLPASRLVPHERAEVLQHHHQKRLDLPFSLGFSSLKDRTKDILNVVASLLLGAACGALTAGTMYLIWSLFNHRNDGAYRSLDGFSSDDGNDDDDDDIFNPKKKGYVAVPAAPVKTIDSEAPVKESADSVKESA